jgi:phosphoribosylaminoimidazole (AIR) synthetase
MWLVFNMGCVFCVMVPEEHAASAVALLAVHHPGTAVIGRVTDEAGMVAIPALGLAGSGEGLQPG